MDTPTTQAPYEIARYLSDEAKRAAVARSYVPRPLMTNAPRSRPRCASGMCPLGIALAVMVGSTIHEPSARQVGLFLRDVAAIRAAEPFIWDWDAGLITDLAAALGVS